MDLSETLRRLVEHPRWPEHRPPPSRMEPPTWFTLLSYKNLRDSIGGIRWEPAPGAMLPVVSDRGTAGCLLALLMDEMDDVAITISHGPDGIELWDDHGNGIGAGYCLGAAAARALARAWDAA